MAKKDNSGSEDAEMPPPVALGAGLATLAISLPLMAATLGLIETSEPVHWALRVFLFLFALPFVVIGGGLAGGGFVLLVNEAVPGDSAFLLRAPRYMLARMARPRHLVAALPTAFLLAQYYTVAQSGVGFFGVSARLLESGIVLEFIAIHATGFLGATTLIPNRGRLRLARFGSFAALSAMYLLIASTQGWEAGLFLAYLIALKLGPSLAGPADLRAFALLFLRWGFQTVLFLSVFTFFGAFDSLWAGTVYWTAITFLELFGMTNVELLATTEGE